MVNLKKLVLIFAAFAATGCSNQKNEKNSDLAMMDHRDQGVEFITKDVFPKGVDADKFEVVEIKITANDQMQFNTNEIKVKAGQKVKLTLEHTGKLPEKVMGHNFVLLQPNTDVAEFAQRAAGARENGYLPENTNNIITHSEMIGGGESTTIEFDAPEAGIYTFICSFPGHFVQMQGKFIVE